jgi:hypothetical protein
MDTFDEPGGALFLAFFVVAGFLLLGSLVSGRLSEGRQTIVWLLFALLFFSVCSMLMRSDARTLAAPSMVDSNQTRVPIQSPQ